MNPRTAAILAAVHGAIIGYAAHRLIGKALGEPDPRTVSAAVHIGFYWRSATALWWGALCAGLCWRFPQLAAPLPRTLVPTVVIVTVLLLLNP